MAAPLKAGLPPEMVIGQGYIVRLTALDATTGNTVSGVVVSQGSIFATHLGGPIEDLVPLPKLVPTDQLV